MTMFNGDNPFASESTTIPCSTSVCPSPSDQGTFCGVTMDDPLPTSGNDCYTCDYSEPIFLNCYVVGFTGKLGLGGSESSLSVDLVERVTPPCSTPAPSCPAASPPCKTPDPPCNPADCGYSGILGGLYTFQLGGFCFRGILSNHHYTESDNGYRYRVTLSDGRQLLSNVNVILNNFYRRVPDKLRPNLINALYELETSVGNDVCGSGERCKDFVKSGTTAQKGMFLKKALEAINGKPCQIPVTGKCLLIDVSQIISIAPDYFRLTSSETNVLELITLATKEAGYDFFIRIEANEIVAVPVSKKVEVSPDKPLFDFIQNLSINNAVSSREYGQELSFEKSKKLVFGTPIHYLISIKANGSGSEPTEPTKVCTDEMNGSCNTGTIPDGIAKKLFKRVVPGAALIDLVTKTKQACKILTGSNTAWTPSSNMVGPGSHTYERVTTYDPDNQLTKIIENAQYPLYGTPECSPASDYLL